MSTTTRVTRSIGDEGGRERPFPPEDESHPLASLMEVVGSLIERYEDEHVPELAEAHD